VRNLDGVENVDKYMGAFNSATLATFSEFVRTTWGGCTVQKHGPPWHPFFTVRLYDISKLVRENLTKQHLRLGAMMRWQGAVDQFNFQQAQFNKFAAEWADAVYKSDNAANLMRARCFYRGPEGAEHYAHRLPGPH
jgi:hypothetical protein